MAIYEIDGTEITFSGTGGGLNVDHVLNSFRDSKSNPTPLVLLHYSDIHADVNRLQSIINFYNQHSTLIDNIIDTGDTNYKLYSDDFSWFNTVSGSQNILRAVGNHEAYTNPAGGNQEMSDVATKFIDPYISNWGVSGHTTGTTYYYKDYTTQGIRLIVLDGNNQSDSTQLSWLENVLADAKTNSLHVIVANHYGNKTTRVNCSFSPLTPFTTTSNSSVPLHFREKIQSFIDGGGTFICHIAGHMHTDIVAANSSHPSQYSFSVTCATNDNFQNLGFADLYRKSSESADAFNILGIDTAMGVLKVFRVGANLDIFGRRRETMAFDYINKTVLY